MAIFTDFESVLAIPANIGRWQIKEYHIDRYPISEASVVQNLRAMGYEKYSVDPLIFQSVAKMSLPIT